MDGYNGYMSDYSGAYDSSSKTYDNSLSIATQTLSDFNMNDSSYSGSGRAGSSRDPYVDSYLESRTGSFGLDSTRGLGYGASLDIGDAPSFTELYDSTGSYSNGLPSSTKKPPSFIPPPWEEEERANDRLPPNRTHKFPRSFTNPRNSNANCASVAAARANGYNTADEMYRDIYNKPYAPEGMGFNHLENMLKKTGREFESVTFPPPGKGVEYIARGITPYQGLEEYMNELAEKERSVPPEERGPPESYIVGYSRPNKRSGHAVNAYRESHSSKLKISDFQHSNFGQALPAGDIETAAEIRIYKQPTPGSGKSSAAIKAEQKVAERNAKRCREGKQSVDDWLTGPRVPDGPLPGFFALHDYATKGRPDLQLHENRARWSTGAGPFSD